MKNTLKDWANALNAYVAFPKRWPDEDRASYLHVFIGKPILGKDGDWEKANWDEGLLIASFYVGDSMNESTLKILPEDSLTAPDVNSKENTYEMPSLTLQTIANLMNMYTVKLADGSIHLYKNRPSLEKCFIKTYPPLPNKDYYDFKRNPIDEEDNPIDRDNWRHNRIINYAAKVPVEDNWFAVGPEMRCPSQFNLNKESFKYISYRECIFKPEN